MWASRKTNSDKGFTIIEVVLVLAIAGLIFIMIFLALPALQRGQRDTQRKSTLQKVAAQATTYKTGNQGSVICSDPSVNATWCGFQGAAYAPSWGTFMTSYLKFIADPAGRAPDTQLGNTYIYAVNPEYTGAYTTNTILNDSNYPPGTIFIAPSAKCDNGAINPALSDKKGEIAFWIKLENGQYCVDG